MVVTARASPYPGALRVCVMARVLVRNMSRPLEATWASQRTNGATVIPSNAPESLLHDVEGTRITVGRVRSTMMTLRHGFETRASYMCLYISQSAGNALHARTISLGSIKIISNTIARSVDLRQNIVPRKSAQQRRHVDAKQQVRNASARNKLKRITKQDAIFCAHPQTAESICE